MDYQAKIVPNDQPNADGEWITITRAPECPRVRDWGLLDNYIPPGYHIVSLIREIRDGHSEE